MIASFVELDLGWYGVRFAYDPTAVNVVRQLPSFARRWDKPSRTWIVDATFVGELAAGLRALGYRINGLDPPRPGIRSANWADTLFERVGPDRAELIFRALTRILHPDNQVTGDTDMQRELNDARNRLR